MLGCIHNHPGLYVGHRLDTPEKSLRSMAESAERRLCQVHASPCINTLLTGYRAISVHQKRTALGFEPPANYDLSLWWK